MRNISRKTAAIVLSFFCATLHICTAQTPTTWTKRSVNPSASNVAGTTVSGVVVVGQPITGQQRSPGTFGWLGMLPLADKNKPSGVDEQQNNDMGQPRRIASYPNPTSSDVALRVSDATDVESLVVVESVVFVDEFGRTTQLPFTVHSVSEIHLTVITLSSGTYTILVQSNGGIAIARTTVLK